MFGLYIHWPFCKSRCPYCDYNAHVRDRVDVEKFGDAILREMDYWGARHNPMPLTSIFFGGGTPSLMPPDLVSAMIAHAREIWGFADAIEITLEANPTSSEAGNFQALAKAGVNRISLGVQALNNADLKFLGRSHDVAMAKDAIAIARENFLRYSFDLIYARPHQQLHDWQNELEEAIGLIKNHVSLYQLSVEPQTAFATSYARGEFMLPDDDDAAILYDYTKSRLTQDGFDAYEISSFARNGDQCRHNLCYWHYHDYIGIGCGSHGRITDATGNKIATANIKTPEAWQDAVLKQGHGITGEERLSAHDIASEMILTNLRLCDGLDIKRLADLTGGALHDFCDPAQLKKFIAGGFLTLDSGYLRATDSGRNCLNALIANLMK